VFDKIVAKGNELTGMKKKLFFWALELGFKYEPTEDQGFVYNTQLGIANSLIFSKWREALGGNIKMITCGSAALQLRLKRVFWAAEIKVLEGYGLTETAPIITASIPTHEGIRFKSVGKIMDGVEVKIAEDGEILAKGPNVMMGYYKDADKTAEVMTGDWFHTGDIGEIFEDNYLRITDRKKEMFKTSGGKYVAPQLIENKFKESNLIEQIMVVGESQKFPGALIVPAFEGVKEWCKNCGETYTSESEMCDNPKLIAQITKDVAEFNQDFGNWEQIKKFKLLPTVWGIETGELTPTLKLKRRIILEKYNKEIDGLYEKKY
jgi:long-chain acyl-CoA synthetase